MVNEPDDPAGRPGEDVKDVPKATLEVDDDAAPVPGLPFEDPFPEGPQDTVPQEPRRRSVLVKGFSAMGLSTIARRFDRRGVGELDEVEQRARDLADTQGHVRPDQAITAMELGMANEKKLNKAVRHVRLLSVLAFLFFVGLFVAVFFASDNAVAKGNVEVKEKIDESVQTDVAVDALGDPHLTDKATGKDITVKADGVVAGTTPRVLNGRKLTCISVVDVAKAVGGLATASAKVNLVFHDEEGAETKITPLSDYEDKQSYLSFDGGRIKILLDSDACDAAAALDKEDAEGVRRLGEPTTSTSRPGSESEGIQAKLRRAYLAARTALREGRRLTGGVEVEVTVAIGGTETTSICPVSLELQCPTYLQFRDKTDLQAAVNAYIGEGCSSNSDCELVMQYGPIGSWDVSRVTDMRELFAGKTSFNKDISDWDTSSVTTMSGMFAGASAFSQDLCAWGAHHSPEVNYYQMFEGSDCANKASPSVPFTNWCAATCPTPNPTESPTESPTMKPTASPTMNPTKSPTDNPTNSPSMKPTASPTMNPTKSPTENPTNSPTKNQTESPTVTPKVFENKAELQAAVDAYTRGGQDQTDIEGTYGPIGSWNVGLVTDMSSLFEGKSSFNEDLSDWDTSSVTDMSRMFKGASTFTGDISDWDTSSVTTMQFMFSGASVFNRPLDWNTSSVTSMNEMFRGASAFESDLSRFDTARVKSMWGMFRGASSFNGDISSWQWDTSSATNMNRMFLDASAFDKNLCAWGEHYDSTRVYTDMFANSGCPSKNEPDGPSTNWCKATCP